MACTITPFVTGQQDEVSSTGSTCVRDYLIDGQPSAGDLPVIGQPFASQPDWPGYEFRVRRYSRVGQVRNAGGVWSDVLRVEGSTSIAPRITANTLVGNVEKDMSGGEQFQVTPDMIGARRAEDADCGKIYYPWAKRMYQFKPTELVYDYDGTSLGVTAGALLFTPNPDNEPARKGQWIYADAKSALIQSVVKVEDENIIRWSSGVSSIGSKNLMYCPITDAFASGTDIEYNMIGRSFWMPIFQVTYYIRTNRYYMRNVPNYPNNGRVVDWGPLGGKKYGPMIASGLPSVDGTWRITNQSVTGITDSDGTDMLKVSRSFIRVPAIFVTSIWNPTMFPTWGTDEWP